MRKAYFLVIFCLILAGCIRQIKVPVYPETAKQNVYATHDSLKNGRIELATSYSDQSIREIPPPEKRIPIFPVIKPPKPGTKGPGQRVIIVPPELGGSPVIVVGSAEYEELLKIVNNSKQLEIDYENLKKAKERTDLSLIAKQKEIEKMATLVSTLSEENNEMKSDIIKKDLIIVGMAVLIGLYIYVRIKGLFPLPF